jgi:hypothetical protein
LMICWKVIAIFRPLASPFFFSSTNPST